MTDLDKRIDEIMEQAESVKAKGRHKINRTAKCLVAASELLEQEDTHLNLAVEALEAIIERNTLSISGEAVDGDGIIAQTALNKINPIRRVSQHQINTLIWQPFHELQTICMVNFV